jgi:hypothetical protein
VKIYSLLRRGLLGGLLYADFARVGKDVFGVVSVSLALLAYIIVIESSRSPCGLVPPEWFVSQTPQLSRFFDICMIKRLGLTYPTGSHIMASPLAKTC